MDELLFCNLWTVLLLFCCTVFTAVLFSYLAIFIATSVRNKLIILTYCSLLVQFVWQLGLHVRVVAYVSQVGAVDGGSVQRLSSMTCLWYSMSLTLRRGSVCSVSHGRTTFCRYSSCTMSLSTSGLICWRLCSLLGNCSLSSLRFVTGLLI